jgi:hypothetical protein
MALLDVAVLVGLGRLDGLALQTVVTQQRLIPPREGVPCRPRRHGGGQPVGAVQLGHAAESPQGVLQAVAEALVALGEAHRAGLPVGVGEHEVVDQVLQRRAGDGHPQVSAVGEVAGGEATGVMDLGEEDLPGRPLLGPPLLDPPLQGPHLSVGEATGELPLQVEEQGLGLQAGVEAELFLQLRPDVGEGVGPCPPGVVHAYLAGQAVKPPVLACGLGVHAGPGRGLLPEDAGAVESVQASHLLIGDHPGPPCRWSPG